MTTVLGAPALVTGKKHLKGTVTLVNGRTKVSWTVILQLGAGNSGTQFAEFGKTTRIREDDNCDDIPFLVRVARREETSGLEARG